MADLTVEQRIRLDRLATEDPDAKVIGAEFRTYDCYDVIIRRSTGLRQVVLPNGRLSTRRET